MYICVSCRNPSTTTTTSAPTDASEPPETLCATCGSRVWLRPRNWAPPKKTNDRAWRRLANGEVLWDRRRVARSYRRRKHSSPDGSPTRPFNFRSRRAVVKNGPAPGRPDVGPVTADWVRRQERR